MLWIYFSLVLVFLSSPDVNFGTNVLGRMKAPLRSLRKYDVLLSLKQLVFQFLISFDIY
jgi:hypothetical protein